MTTERLTCENCSQQLLKLLPPVFRVLRRRLGESDALMSPSQLRILDFLTEYPGSSLCELSELLEITNATASSHVDRLVKRGLVGRAADLSERRRVILTLTAEGKRVLESMNAVSRNLFAQMLAPLSSAQVEHIREGLAALDEAVKRYHHKQTHREDEVR